MNVDPIRVKEIFLAAAELPDDSARIAYVEQVCNGDVELWERVEALLRSHDPAGSFLGSPAAAFTHPNADEQTIESAISDAIPRMDHDEDRAEALAFLSAPTRPDSLGRIGHYEALQVLGAGGFGIVLRAFDDILQRVVAIKVMAPQMAATSPARRRFLREARSSAQVRHENVVQVYEVAEQPLPYLVMEFIPGETLQQRLDRKGPLDIQEVLRIGRQISEGLAAAHGTDLIHRDIKPGNILLEGGNHRVKITDFGLARAADDASMTQSGMIAGTPMYMAPEQALGQPLDQRADLFSLGSVLYQMVSGRAPFRANTTIAVLKRVAEDTPRNMREIIPETPQWLCDIIAKLHAKKPEDRYQSAREVAEVLADCEAQLKANSKLKDFSLIPHGVSNRSGRKWMSVAAALLLLCPLALAVTELVGMTRLFQPEKLVATADRIKSGNESQAAQATAWHGWPMDAPKPAVAPFDAAQARGHQEAWATHLGVPVEYTNTFGMRFMLIPPGEFTMGSTAAEIKAALKDAGEDKRWQDCVRSEAFQHKVILTQPIYLGVNEVTQSEYERIMGENPAEFSPIGTSKEAVAGMETIDHPVEMVSWNDAVEFCAKLSQEEDLKPYYSREGETITPLHGKGYRLPSEAEWEFACRAGAATKYWMGDKVEDLAQVGWFGGNEGIRTHAVGQLKANPFGLADIHGNVWEWVQDGWDAKGYGHFHGSPAINPSTPFSEGTLRVLRGGGWHLTASRCRSSHRSAGFPLDRDGSIGFRVSLPVDTVIAARRRKASAAMASQNIGVPPKPIRAAGASIIPRTYSPDGKWLVAKTRRDGQLAELTVWDVATGELRETYHCALGSDQRPAFSPDGHLLAVTEEDDGHQFITLVETGSFRTRKRWPIARQNDVYFSFNRTGQLLATGAAGSITLWDTESGEPVDQIGDAGSPFALAFSPKADVLAYEDALLSSVRGDRWGLDSRIVLVDVDPASATYKKRLQTWEAPDNGSAHEIKFTPDGSRLVFCRSDGTQMHLAVVDVKTGKVVHEPKANNGFEHQLLSSILPDGKTLVTVQGVGFYKVYVWDLETGRQLRSFKIPPLGGFAHLATDPTGETLCTGGENTEELQFYRLGVGGNHAQAVAPITIADMQRIADLPANVQVEEVRAALKSRNPDFDGALTPTIENDVVTGLEFLANDVRDLSPVRALPRLIRLNCRSEATLAEKLADLSPLKGMRLSALKCSVSEITDLSPLRGMQLSELHIDNSPVADLSSLEGMPLAVLNCSFTKVSSLLPLKEAPLVILWCNNTDITDLSPLQGKQLQWITIQGTKVTDISILKGMPLTQIYLDYVPERDRDTLRSLPNLQTINDLPTAEFWQQHDASPND